MRHKRKNPFKPGNKVTLSENGNKLTVIGSRRTFGSAVRAIKVMNSEGDIEEYTQDQFFQKSEDTDIEKGKAVPVGTKRGNMMKTANGWKWQGKGKGTVDKPETGAPAAPKKKESFAEKRGRAKDIGSAIKGEKRKGRPKKK